MLDRVAIILISFCARDVAKSSRMIPVIVLCLKDHRLSVTLFTILRFRKEDLMEVRHRLIFYRCVSNKGRSFAILRLVKGVRRPLNTLTDLTRIRLSFNYLLKDCVRVVRAANPCRLATFRCLPLRVVNEGVARRMFVRRVSFTILRINQDDPSILVSATCLVRIKVKRAIKTSGAIVTRIAITNVGAIGIATMNVGRLAIFSYPACELVGGVPGGTALRFKVFARRVPVFFGASLQISRHVDVFTLGRKLYREVVLAMFLASIVTVVRQTVSIYLTYFANLFVLCNATQIFDLCPVMNDFRVDTVTNFITREPRGSTKVVRTALRVTLIALRVYFPVILAFNGYLFPVARSIKFSVNFNRCMGAVLITRIMPRVVIKVITNTRNVRIRLLRRLGVLGRTFTEGSMAAIQVRLITINSLRRGKLTISGCLASFRLCLSRTRLCKGRFATTLRDNARNVRMKHFYHPLVEVLRVCRNDDIAFNSDYDRLFSNDIRRFGASVTTALRVGLCFRKAILVDDVRVKDSASILGTLLIANVRMTVTPCATVARRILIFRVHPIAPTRCLGNCRVLLSQLRMKYRIRFDLRFTILAVACMLTICPRVRVKDRKARVDGSILALPINECCGLAAMKACVIVLH